MTDINLHPKWSHRDQWIGNLNWLKYTIRVRIHLSNQQSINSQQQQLLSILQTNTSYWDNHFRQYAAKQYIENPDNLHLNNIQSILEKQTISQLASDLTVREIEITHTGFTISLDDQHLLPAHSLQVSGTLDQELITAHLLDIRQQFNKIIDTIETNPTKQTETLEHLINLYPDAINSYEHDIADSIPLFVVDIGDNNTCQYLNILKDTTSDTTLQNEFTYWIKAIEAKNEKTEMST